MPKEPNAIKNILVVRNDRFGEFLLNIPALRALKESFVNAKITVIINPDLEELVKYIPYIDNTISWESKRHSLPEKFKLIRLLKKSNFDMAIILNPSKELNFCAYLSGIPTRVGYNRKWGFLLTNKIEDRKNLAEKHEVEYNLDLVALIGAKTSDKTPSLEMGAEIAKEDLIAIHPWTSDPLKQWPLERFAELAKKIKNEIKISPVIVGGKENLAAAKKYFSNLENITDLTGKTSLKQLAELLKKARLLISGDSGPMHLAAAVGTPVVALFRNDLPGKTARRWGPVGREHIILEKNSLLDITVEEVFSKVKSFLEK